MPEPTTTADLVEVEFQGGVKGKLPPAEAELYKAARTKDKAEREEMAKTLGGYKAERDAADAKIKKAEAEKAEADAVKAGEIEKIREVMTKDHREREAKFHASLVEDRMRAAVASNPDVVATAVDDLVAQLKSRATFDPDANALIIKDAAGKPLLDPSTGKPIGADALVKDFLSTRPHYRKNSTPDGTGAAQPAQPAKGSTLSAAQMELMGPMQKAKFFQDGGKQVG